MRPLPPLWFPERTPKVRATAEASLIPEELTRVRFLSPDALLALVRDLEAEGLAREQTIRGYRVKTKFKPAEPGDSADRKDAVAQVVAGAIRRITGRRE